MSFTVEEDRPVPARHARPGSAIGVDLGVKALLTGVDDQGNVITVPGPAGPAARPHRQHPGGRAARRPVTRNHRLARALTDQGLGAVRRLLGYKTGWNGGTLVLANRNGR